MESRINEKHKNELASMQAAHDHEILEIKNMIAAKFCRCGQASDHDHAEETFTIQYVNELPVSENQDSKDTMNSTIKSTSMNEFSTPKGTPK